MASSSELHFNAAPVSTYLNSVPRELNIFSQNLQALLDVSVEIGSIAANETGVTKLDSLRATVAKLLELQHEVTVMGQVVNSFGNYQPSLDCTDFSAELQSKACALMRNSSFDPRSHPQYQQLEQALRGGAEEGGPGDTDEVQCETTGMELAPNHQCPISAKRLLDIQEPVMDSKGYVYEKAAILSYIQQAPGQRVACPCAGTSHILQASELKKAGHVIRRKLAVQSQRGGPYEDEDEDGGVIDV